MAGKEENRIFVGGLSWETNDRRLEQEFSRFGKVLEVKIMTERESGRPRGFGFVTFSDARSMEDSIREMHNKTLDGRQISVNKAQPKMSTDDTGYGYSSGGYSSGGRGSYRGGDAPAPGHSDECFKCGKRGHWARECPSAGGGGKLPSRSRYGEGGGGGRGDRFGGSDRFNERYMDDRYDGGRYGERDRFDREKGYGGGRDRYASDRYGPPGDRLAGDRYGGGPPDRFPNGYNKERSYDRDVARTGGGYDRDLPIRGGGYDRDVPIRGSGGYDRDGPRGVGGDKYVSGGPVRYEGGYRDRPGPYDRPSRGARPSSYDRY